MLVVAHRHDLTIDGEGRLQVRRVVAVGRRPCDQAEREEEQGREDRDDDGLLAPLALPAGHALPLREAWEWDPSGHGDFECTERAGPAR